VRNRAKETPSQPQAGFRIEKDHILSQLSGVEPWNSEKLKCISDVQDDYLQGYYNEPVVLPSPAKNHRKNEEDFTMKMRIVKVISSMALLLGLAGMLKINAAAEGGGPAPFPPGGPMQIR
jgi:hypothetical protein